MTWTTLIVNFEFWFYMTSPISKHFSSNYFCFSLFPTEKSYAQHLRLHTYRRGVGGYLLTESGCCCLSGKKTCTVDDDDDVEDSRIQN